VKAIEAMKAAGLRDLETFSPVPVHEIEEALEQRPSPVRIFTLVGGLLGLVTGWTLTIGAALHYPLIVGGKPIVSLPPFVIVSYILTILFGAVATILGLLIFGRLPRFRRDPVYDPRFSGDHYGLAVACDRDRVTQVEQELKSSGAIETRTVE
jgi:uncharacterized membrane protein